MTGHQWITSTGTLLEDFSVSTGRVKVLTILVSNSTLTELVLVCVKDVDGNTLMDIACPPKETTSVVFAEPVDFSNGLLFDAAPSSGGSFRVTVAHSRRL